MNKKFFALFALLLVVGAVLSGGVLAVSAAPSDGPAITHDEPAECGGLRMDEFYACHFGGWQPTPAAEDLGTTAGVNCGGLRADELYACRSAGWLPADAAPVTAR